MHMAHENRDRVSNRPDAASTGTLVHTRDLDDFKPPKDEPDPRGWDVRATDGSKVGKVEDMLFDTGERRIRYVEVALDKDFAKDIARDYALIPIGQARLDDDNDHVIVDLSSTDLASIPRYDRQNLSRDYETSLRSWYRERKRDVKDTVTTAGATDRDAGFYSSPEYDDQRFFARGRGEQRGTADRGTMGRAADRVADAVDNVKDRIDGNPASRPGPDPTDRRA
jgi:sporulation protein YlmC with PRC-barrel domain